MLPAPRAAFRILPCPSVFKLYRFLATDQADTNKRSAQQNQRIRFRHHVGGAGRCKVRRGIEMVPLPLMTPPGPPGWVKVKIRDAVSES